MENYELTPEEKAVRNAYQKEYNNRNKEQRAAIVKRYWQKKVAQMKKEKEVESAS
jgi:hypothetical protein